MKKRCAIYTRKSSDEGLDQPFNSLDAQRDSCRAFIESQRQEGWSVVPQHFDDGGYSGGNMKRPGLEDLLTEIRRGNIDVVVVYKIDRLTRSLSDFARIIDIFDQAGTAFVSVTQAFNSGNSMGRLMLHVLLSFAQFEREVTAERIRDKIAASKARGMWMGGHPPLGYDVVQRRLVVNEIEAETVRRIMRMYVELGCVSELVSWMRAEGIRTKQRHIRGVTCAPRSFEYGAVRRLLSNRTYVGQVEFQGSRYRGEHDAIVEAELFELVQLTLQGVASKTSGLRRPTSISMLSGLLFDSEDRPMGPSHAVKNGQRYRYYITRPKLITKGGTPGLRIPAGDLERAVCQRLAAHLQQADAASTLEEAQEVDAIMNELLSGLLSERRARVAQIVSRVELKDGEAHIFLKATSEIIKAPLKRVRHGNDMLMIRAANQQMCDRDEQLFKLLGDAHSARKLALSKPDQSLEQLAASFGRSTARFKRLLRLSYLSPDIVQAVAAGEQPATLTSPRLQHISNIPPDWAGQRKMLLS